MPSKRAFLLAMNNKGPYVDYLFDKGSVSSYSVVDVATPTIRITPVRHWSSNWAWWAIRSKHWEGKTPHFLIAKSAHYSMDITERLAVWGTNIDGDIWHDFDSVTEDANDVIFYNNTPFPAGTIYIAALPMYPFSRIQRKMSEWAADARVTQTSSTTNFVLGHATSRALGDGSGRTSPPLPFYGFKISKANSNTKNKMVITAYSHPSETHGPFQLEGAMDWMLGGSVEAELLLDWFDVYVYPCINPQGVEGGWFRSSPQTPNDDNNRIWDTTGVNEAVDAFKTAMAADVGGDMEIGIDFHGWMSSSATPFSTATDITTAAQVAYFAKIQTIRPTYSMLASDIPTSLKAWQEANLTPYMTIGPEVAGGKTISAIEYKNIGRDVLRTFELMSRAGYFTNGPGVGSRSFNGTTDRIDWASVANLKNTPTTVSAWARNLGAGATSDYMLQAHKSGNTAYGLVFYLYGGTEVGLIVASGSPYVWKVGFVPDFTSGWHHFLATWDGSLNSSGVNLYCDGNLVTNIDTQTNGTTAEDLTGSWSVGGRIYDDLRNFNGKLAQVACWNRVLTAGEIALLAGGYSPDRAAASSLLFYFKANTSSLVASVGGTGTADGTTFSSGPGNGPGIIYP